MKVLKLIKRVFVGIVAVIFFAFALLMTVLLLNYNDYGVTQFGDTTLIIIKDEIATNKYKKGDLIFVESQKIDKIKPGDDIFAYVIDDKGRASIDLGKVKETYPDEKAISYENGSTYAMEFVIGKGTKTYSNVGQYLSIIESKWGFLFIVLVPCFLIFIYELYNLIIEIKYGDEETAE